MRLIITGTPGTGKTTLARELSLKLDLEYIDVNKLVETDGLSIGFDRDRKCKIVDEVKLKDVLEKNKHWKNATIIGRRLDANGKRKDEDKSIPIVQCLEVRKSNLYKSGCLTTVAKDNVITPLPIGRHFDVYGRGLKYRNLTPIECERLQTVPDNYTQFVSDNQRLKMLGNGWTVKVIEHILKEII